MQVQAFSDRPGYERTSSSLWKQREDYCATLIQQAWRDHYKEVKRKGGARREKVQANPRMQMNGKNLIEVQPSPSPEN